jgi:hypothetical protein
MSISILAPSPLNDAGAAAASVTTRPFAVTPSIAPQADEQAGAPAATATVSPWAQILSKLQRLQQSNPDVFKRVAGAMGDTVRSEAQRASGGDAQALDHLSGQLKQAAKTGDLQVFKPTHHPHHTRSQSSGASTPLLQALLAQVDHVLGPGATPAS